MPSDVEIANLALTKLGTNRISSFSEDSKEGRAVIAVYNLTRDAELEAHAWKFCIKRTNLAKLVDTPVWGFDFLYQLPADYLRILQIGEAYPGVSFTDYRAFDETEWRIEGRRIATNLDSPLPIRYVAKVTDPNLWHPLFIKALAAKLVGEMAIDMLDSNPAVQLAAADYAECIKQAIQRNAIESAPEPLPDDTWMLSRL